MRVLVACEYSANVRDAFRGLGHDAWSVDTEPTERDPRWHIQGDALDAAYGQAWDMLIAFPPCTHLSCAGAGYWRAKREDGRQGAAVAFVMALWLAPIERVAIENPQGILSTIWMSPTQVIQPWQFGHPFTKRTHLWLRGLPPLSPTCEVAPVGPWVAQDNQPTARRARAAGGGHRNPRERSRTFTNIAVAMALQWGGRESWGSTGRRGTVTDRGYW